MGVFICYTRRWGRGVLNERVWIRGFARRDNGLRLGDSVYMYIYSLRG